jgi:hypothetical protein
MRFLASLALCGLMVFSFPSAQAQSVSATPTYGNVRLSGGFMPDPHLTRLTAGGSIAVNRGQCSYGRVADAPDIDLYYEGNGGRTLYIYAVATEDVTLLVNTPDGAWICDDDSYGDRDPILVIPKADSGLYNVWVGTYGSEMTPARLYISEIDPRTRQ